MHVTLKTGRIAALFAGAAMAATIAAAPARADVIGQLQCNISAGAGQLIVSSRPVSCTFTSAAGPVDLYNGSINRLGVDIGELSGGTIVYNVAALGPAGPGALAGDYVGAGFGVTLGTGAGLNALVGGNSLALQPIAATTSTGNNINAGVGALRLAYVGPAAVEAPVGRRGVRRHLRRHSVVRHSVVRHSARHHRHHH